MVGNREGANLTHGGVNFRTWAPNARSVSLRDRFSGWEDLLLQKDLEGYWRSFDAGVREGDVGALFSTNNLNQDDRSHHVGTFLDVIRTNQMATPSGNSLLDVECKKSPECNFFFTRQNQPKLVAELTMATFENALINVFRQADEFGV